MTRQRARGDRPPDDEDTIDLSRFVRIFDRHGIAVVFRVLLGFYLARLRSLKYQGVTTLLVVPPSQPNGVQMNRATFRAIVENATLTGQVDALWREFVHECA